MTPDELRGLIPRHKTDMEAAQRLVALGYPTLKPILPEILGWIEDANDMVAWVFIPFVLGLGDQVLPEVRAVLAKDFVTEDEHGYHGDPQGGLLSLLVWQYPIELVRQLVPELERLAFAAPSSSGEMTEASAAAFVTLARHQLGEESAMGAAAHRHLDARAKQPHETLTAIRSWPRDRLVDLTPELKYWSRYPVWIDTALIALDILMTHGLDRKWSDGSIEYLRASIERRRAHAERDLVELERVVGANR